MDKIIFLDIDGVLNSNFWNETHQREISDGTLIDAEKVALLGELVRRTKAKVVLHSGWRFWFDAGMNPTRTESARLAELLRQEGMELYDVTPDLTTEEIRRTRKFSLVKAKEILTWLDAHREAGSWVVLDDLDLHDARIAQRQVRTDQTVGLTRQDIEKAERMLSAFTADREENL